MQKGQYFIAQNGNENAGKKLKQIKNNDKRNIKRSKSVLVMS